MQTARLTASVALYANPVQPRELIRPGRAATDKIEAAANKARDMREEKESNPSSIQGKGTAMFQTILVPLDGSTFGEQALPLALGIASQAKASVRLVHVLN